MICPLDYYIDVTPFAVGGPYQVQLTFNFPDISSVYYSDGVATIGPSVEYPNAFYGYVRFNLKLRELIITHLIGGDWDGGYSFWGPVVTSLTSGANLPQPVYFISYSTTNGPGILTSTPTTIALNWQGLTFYRGDYIVIGW